MHTDHHDNSHDLYFRFALRYPSQTWRDGERDRLGNAQTVGVDDREAGPIEGHLQRGDQAAAIGVTADVGQPPPVGLADFFW